MEYAQVLAHAVDTFGSKTNANAWLNRPNRMFANQTPLQVLTEDPAAVEEELVRIDHGMFV
jgi:putative toxin-antitoxin system antitoxin component (TIGR02293 family)